MPTSHPYRRVLAIDTATPVQAICLVDGDTCLEHRVLKVRYNHGSSLLKNVDTLLASQGLDLGDLDLFCAGLGPGSFTALRVGLAMAKALSRSREKPITGVSSLAAQAYATACARQDATVITAIDARRAEVYAGGYRWDPDQGLLTAVPEAALSPRALVDAVEAIDGPVVLLGDGVQTYAELQRLAARDGVDHLPLALAPPSALGVALLGRARALRDGPDDRISLEPNYLRPSDAKLPNIAPHPDYPHPDE